MPKIFNKKRIGGYLISYDDISRPFTEELNKKRLKATKAIFTAQKTFFKSLKVTGDLDVRIHLWFKWIRETVNKAIDIAITAGKKVSRLVKDALIDLYNIQKSKQWENLSRIYIPYLVVELLSLQINTAANSLNTTSMAITLQQLLTTEEVIYMSRCLWGKIQIEIDRWILSLKHNMLAMSSTFVNELDLGLKSLDLTVNYIGKRKDRRAVVPFLALRDMFLSESKISQRKMVMSQMKRLSENVQGKKRTKPAVGQKNSRIR